MGHDQDVTGPEGPPCRTGSPRARRALAALAALALAPLGCGENPGKELTGVVERGNFVLRHVEPDGELASLTPLTVSARVHGQIEFIAKDLSRVEDGEVLVELEKTDHENEVKQLKDDLDSAEKRLTEELRNMEVESAQLEVELEKKKAALRLAEVKLEESRAGAKPEEILIAGKNLEATEAALAFAGSVLEDTRDLLTKGFASQSDLDEKALAREFALARFEKARMRLETLRRGPTAHELRPAELAAEEAGIEAEIARERMITRKAALKQSVAWRQATVAGTREHLARHEQRLAQATIRAPRSGLVVRCRQPWGDEAKIDVGGHVWPGRGIIEFPDLSELKARTRIPESLVRHFSVGDEVTVMVDDIPDERFEGRIIWIDSWARDKNARLAEADQEQAGLSGVRVFRADVKLERTDERMRLGSKIGVEMTRTIPDVVCVDKRAVVRRGGRTFVRAVDGRGVRLVPVALGESNDDACVVRSGLEPGARVAFSDDVFGPAVGGVATASNADAGTAE